MTDSATSEEPEGATAHCNVLLPMPWSEGTIDTIVRALHEHPETRASMAAAGGLATGQPQYVSLSELGGKAPPPGVPFLNDAIGVLSVPAPPDSVKAALGGVAPDVRVEPGATYHI